MIHRQLQQVDQLMRLRAEERSTEDEARLGITIAFSKPCVSPRTFALGMAAASGRPYEVKRLQTVAIPKAKVLGETHGLLKAIVDTETGLYPRRYRSSVPRRTS